MKKIDFLAAEGCTDVVCGRLGQGAVQMLMQLGIEVHAGQSENMFSLCRGEAINRICKFKFIRVTIIPTQRVVFLIKYRKITLSV